MALHGVAEVVDVLDALGSLFLIVLYIFAGEHLAPCIDPHPQLLIDSTLHLMILWCLSICYIFKRMILWTESPQVNSQILKWMFKWIGER